MITNSDITIYNKYFDKATRMDKWKRTVLSGVFWEEKLATNRLQSGVEHSDAIMVVVPLNVDTTETYLPPMEFKKQENNIGYFTFQKGDRIVRGNIDFELENSTNLDKEYEAFTITSIDTKDFGSSFMRHWEVGAK